MDNYHTASLRDLCTAYDVIAGKPLPVGLVGAKMSRDKANKRVHKIQITYNRIDFKELEFCEGDDVSVKRLLSSLCH